MTLSGVRLLTGLEPRHEAGIVARLSSVPGVELVRRCPDLADLVAAGAAGLADLALVSGGLRGLERDVIAHLAESGVTVIGVAGDEIQERRLRQLGVATILPADSETDEIASALTRAAARAPDAGAGAPDHEWAAVEAGLDPTRAAAPRAADDGTGQGGEPDRARGSVVAVWGPTGAPGRTSLAINAAAELAATGQAALLIDADTYGACVGQMLGLLDEAPGIAAAARAAELGTLDLPALARLAPTVEPGFRVLTGLPSSGRWTEVRADSMRVILDLARSLADIVIVDCGFCLEDDEELSYDTRAPRRNAAAVAVVAEADVVLAVGAGDPVGLQRLVRALHDVRQVAAVDPRVVVNRVRAGVAGGSPERRIADVLGRFAGIGIEHLIPDDRAAFDRALLAGRPLLEVAPKSPARARIRTLAQALAPAPAPDGTTVPRGRRLRSATIGRWSTA